MTRGEKVKAVFRVASGNFLEMYDFIVYGYYAAAIGAAFFPTHSEFATLMASFATFGVGFLMRPLGGLILGAYIDRHGRRAGLLMTLGLMGLGTLTLAVTPGYATIGVLAPAIVLLGRLLQGFSAGAELGGVSVYLAEMATPGHKGFYVSWQSGSQQVAVIFTALLGVVLGSLISPAQMADWGWRVPLLIGCFIVPLLFWVRRSLGETEAFARRAAGKARPTAGAIFRSLAQNWGLVVLGMMLVTMTTVSFYLITAYTPTYGKQVLHLAGNDALIVTLLVGISNLFWLPVGGAISDRIGRFPVLVGCCGLALLSAYPAISWLVGAPSFTRLLVALLWLSFIYGLYNGAMVVYLTEIMPVEVRTAGFSLAYSLATAIFGGFTPLICTWLIHVTDNRAMPGLWLSFAALLGLVATLLVRRRAVEAERAEGVALT
ncbi:MFS transporter [Roseomonas sp. SG15]|uniref:MFS transporter n=2 Tax=Roseomonas indoligenes TaxID=2820811 RepID=A0A940S432_9PROT|nr:MFS transporter [Pararoseomonas indoligenes]MBP0491564.1 MFS transporter [Pararoseomonas indoligenes]